MANFVKSTDFAAKDALLSGDPEKIINGTEIDTEFNAISVAVSTKADTVSPTFIATPAAPTATPGTNTTQIATTAFAKAAVDAATASLGTMSTQAANNVAITGGSVTGITDITVADGGTGRSTLTANNVLLGNGTSAVNFVAPSTSGNVLTSNGTSWSSAAPSVSTSSFTGSNQSLATSGYQKLPGGLIMQWGTGGPLSGRDQSQAQTFPISFPNAYLSISLTRTGPVGAIGGDKKDSHYVSSVTTSGFIIYSDYEGISNVTYSWLAFGY